MILYAFRGILNMTSLAANNTMGLYFPHRNDEFNKHQTQFHSDGLNLNPHKSLQTQYT